MNEILIEKAIDLMQRNVVEALQTIHFDASVKEPGHSFGEKFEETFSEKLSSLYPEIFSLPVKVKGKGKQTRLMEDFYIHDKPTNIKFGFQKCGQPNICSFTRLLEKYHNGDIDSYWIAMVNVLNINLDFDFYFFNVYDYLDCMHYNYGTGQVMLKEKQFFDSYNQKRDRRSSKKKHMLLLKEMNDKAFASHISLKQQQYEDRSLIFDIYK
jgi:hypothetical protein